MLLASGIAALLLAGPARAGGPTGPFPRCAEDRRDDCPRDLRWHDTSWIPDESRATIREAELALGSGVSLDRALRHTAGRFDVTVAIIDSGIEWFDTQLNDKVALNTAELPLPQRADGSTIGSYDLDGNGIVNVLDYAEDPRVGAASGNELAAGLLDPSDLLAVFSDGIDDDGNGFVDDIAGWDFFEHDNDPFAGYLDGYSGHGTGVMKTATAWADDGGDLGACPDCSVLPLRIGEAFVTDGDRVAMAIAYAADRGVASAGLAIGSLTHPAAVDAAAHYAQDRGVVLVSAGGDENAWHRNQPAGASPFLFVKSVRATDRKENGPAYSYFNTWNCNNFGPRMDLVAPSEACATGATAKIAGLAALVRSAALDAEVTISAPQIRALLMATADDVDLSAAEQERAHALPSGPGWDPFHGHGRVNVGAAVQALRDGDVPPVARITSPAWFAWAGDQVELTADVAAPATVVIELGRGGDPDAWDEVATVQVADASGLSHTLTLEPTPVTPEPLGPSDSQLDRYARAHEPLITLRIRVTDGDGRTAEDRVAVWRHTDEDLRAGWPVVAGGSIDGGVNLADLDEDGIFEVIAATASGDVHALRGDATPLAGWPRSTGTHPAAHTDSPAWSTLEPPHEGIVGMPAVGDVNGDGTPDVVVGTTAGGVWAWNADGAVLDGFPVYLDPIDTPLPPGVAWDRIILGAPALADIDGDGSDEIVVSGGDQQLWVFEAEGRVRAGFPLLLCHPDNCGVVGSRIVAPPALGDVDGDGDLDAVVGSGESPPGDAGVLFVVDLSAATISSVIERDGLYNDALLPIIGEGHPSATSLVDLDDDGDLELLSAAMLSPADPLHHDGEVALDVGYTSSDVGARSTYTEGASVQMVNLPAAGDLDGDGVEDIVVGGSGATYLFSLTMTRYTDHQHGMFAWSGATGLPLPGFPQQSDSVAFLSAPAIADITGDGKPEVLYSSSGHWIYAVDEAGTQAPGWPKFHGGWAMGGPSVGDIDGDGLLEVVIATRDGMIFTWDTEGPADGPTPWPRPRRDAANTGDASLELPRQDGPRGCGCQAVQTPWTMLVLLPVLVMRRRRA